MIKSFGSSKFFDVIFLSNKWEGVYTHFFNKTLLCAGHECIGCFEQTRRATFYTWGVLAHQIVMPLVMELPSSIHHFAMASLEESNEPGTRGLRLRCVRENVRSQWRLDKWHIGKAPLDEPSHGLLISNVAKMFGLPAADEQMSLQMVIDQCNTMVRAKLQRAMGYQDINRR